MQNGSMKHKITTHGNYKYVSKSRIMVSTEFDDKFIYDNLKYFESQALIHHLRKKLTWDIATIKQKTRDTIEINIKIKPEKIPCMIKHLHLMNIEVNDPHGHLLLLGYKGD